MADSHRIEDARVGRLGCRQVGITVEIDQAEVGLAARKSGDHAKRDGAIPAKHNGDQVSRDGGRHRIGDLARDVEHRVAALSLALDLVRRKARDRKIPEVLHLEPGFPERP